VGEEEVIAVCGEEKAKKKEKGFAKRGEWGRKEGSPETMRSASGKQSDCSRNDYNRVFCPPETSVL